MKLSGGPTQDEVLAIDLSKLALSADDRFIDIGCGTGTVSIAAAGSVREVIAIDRREEAVEFAKTRAAEAAKTNITFVHAEAEAYLENAGRFDAAFVGGSRNLRAILTLLARQVDGPIVVNAVLLDTVHEAVSAMKTLGIFREALLVQISRSHPLAGSIMWKPIDPVYVIVGGKTRC
jgi:cobalt-precorrin-6B (C15)-methyltransferase